MRRIITLLTAAACLFAASPQAQFAGLGEGLTATPSRINFGRTKLGEASKERFMLRQTSKQTVRNLEIRIDSGGRSGFSVLNHNCPAMFRSSKTCWVRLEFSPKEAKKARGRAVITSASGTIYVELRGNGTQSQ